MDASGRLDIDTSIWWPSATIPALADYGLDVVPGFRLKQRATIPTGWRPTPGEANPYEDTRWRHEHKAWTRALLEARPKIHAAAIKDPEVAKIERALCAQDPNYFGAVYGWIFDPKPMVGETMHKPYAKFAYQCHNTSAQQRIVALPERAWLWRPKSRQLGISWDDEHFDLWFYLFGEGQAKLFSRSEKWVYNGTSTEAMMGKILYIMRQMEEASPYLLPQGLSVRQLWRAPHFRDLVLTNPDTGTSLTGESTTGQVGRGGTYTYARPDESGHLPDINKSFTSVEMATPHVFPAGTETLENGDEWLALWQAAKREKPDSVLECNWHQNAYCDLDWELDVLGNALTKHQQEGVMRESFRDPFAGFGTWCYPEARALPDANQPYRPDEPLDLTIDAAGSGDITAILTCQATAIDGVEGFHVLWSLEREMPNVEWNAHILTGIWPERGDSCYGMQPDPQEDEVGRFLYACWLEGRELRFFMDPASDQHHSKASYFDLLRDKSKELRLREYDRLTAINMALNASGKPLVRVGAPKAIHPRFKLIYKHRLQGDREYALRKYLNHVTFQTGVPSAARVRECLGRVRYNDLDERAVTDAKRRHDQYSHLASCAEYYAIYYRYHHQDPLDTKELQKRQRALGGPGTVFVPGGFGRLPALPKPKSPFGSRPAPPDRVAPGGWR